MTSALQYITNIDPSFPKPGQDNPSQGFRSNFANIQQALSKLNSHMDSLAATTLNIVAPSITATQSLTALNTLKIGNTNSVYASIVGYNDLVITGKNSDGTDGAGSVPLFLNVIGVGRVSYGTDGNGSYFVSNTAIDKILVGATFSNILLTKFTVTRIDVGNNKIYYTPDSGNNLPATVKITNPPLGGGVAAFQNTLNSFVPIGSIILWYGAVGTIPTGWQLCDGTTITLPNGTTYPTPDLRDRFVVGAGGNYTAGSAADAAMSEAGSHSHSGNTAASSVTIESFGWGTVGGDLGAATAGTLLVGSGNTEYRESLESIRQAGAARTTGSHSHNIGIDGSHIHSFNPPYYALCYIMKTS